MKYIRLIIVAVLLLPAFCRAQEIVGLSYPADPAQQTHPDIPKGEILKFEFNNSTIFPGTKRTYWVYLPAQYKPEKPACLYVDMDGIQFGAPTVFDYLIAKGEMPVTIGVFISSGVVMKNDTDVARYNRGHEFDSMNSDFVNFILTELLPDIESKKATDGRAINISKDANDHAIAGASSGAICAFTAAWQRPDAFSRVYSSIGTYVGMRGGDQYPELVRKTEPKPIRIFLQDGVNDAWNPLFGNWYTANLNMEAALSFAGYEVNHAWGNGGHDGKQATAIFPDVMRWLWKGWPLRVQNGKTNNNMLTTILPDTGTWQLLNKKISSATAVFADWDGTAIVEEGQGLTEKFDIDGELLITANLKRPATSNAGSTLNYSPPTRNDWSAILASRSKEGILAMVPGAKSVTTNEGKTYIACPATYPQDKGKILLLRPGSKAMIVDSGLRFASAITVSPDRSLLLVAEDNTNWIYSYVIQPDGTLKYKQKWYWLHQTDGYGYSKVSDMAMDNEGNLYAATNLGVQVCDQNGRVRAILQLPYGPVTGLCFAGKDFDTLLVICDGKVYKRKFKVKGLPAWAPPVHPKSIGAG